MKIKITLIILLFFLNILYSNDLNQIIYLPLIKEQNNRKICYIFSSLTGEILSNLECEDTGKQSKDLIPLKFKNKWGYVNQFGTWVISPEFDFADNFYSDLARVVKNNKYGFIDKQGNVVIDFIFPYAGNFMEGEELTPFQCDEKNHYLFGYIDKQGKIVIPCEFQMAYDFRNKIAKARKWDLYGYISYDNKNRIKKILQNFSYRLAGDYGNSITYVLRNDKFFFISTYGKLLKILENHYIPGNFSITDPLANFQDLKSGYFGYFDTTFKIIIPPIFLEAEEFYLGFAKVKGPVDYHNKDYDTNLLLLKYKEKKFEEFYIDTLGRRITFHN